MNLFDKFNYFLIKIKKYQVLCIGSISLDGSLHTKLIGKLSGGQKARAALVKLMFDSPHLLLLYEPTNHLDIETVKTLIDCLSVYNGGILTNRIWFLDKETKKINYKINSLLYLLNKLLS